MNETHIIANDDKAQAVDKEFHAFDLALAFANHKKLIVGLPVAAVLIAVAVSFLLPNIYRANTKLLPPQQAQSGAAALLAQVGGPAALGAAGIKNPNDLYIGMLKSRTVADNLIKRFDLKRRYDTDSTEKARTTLEENTAIVAGKDGIISIFVEDEDQQFVAKIANGYVDELLALTKVLALTEAGQRRMFFERQLELSKNNLASAEITLKQALEKRGVISVDSDSRAMVETVSRIRAQISAKEIQISSMSAFVTANNNEFKRARQELNSLRAELSNLENGRPGSDGEQGGNQQVGLQNIQILRDVKYHQMLYEMLSKQYEAARLDEAKDSAIVQVLDKAVDPERKWKPRRAIAGITAGILALFAAMAWALLMDAKQRALRDPAKAAQWAKLMTQLRGR